MPQYVCLWFAPGLSCLLEVCVCCCGAGALGTLGGVIAASSTTPIGGTPAQLSPRPMDATDGSDALTGGLLSNIGTSMAALSLADQASLAGRLPSYTDALKFAQLDVG